jgi:hypothetical protein
MDDGTATEVLRHQLQALVSTRFPFVLPVCTRKPIRLFSASVVSPVWSELERLLSSLFNGEPEPPLETDGSADFRSDCSLAKSDLDCDTFPEARSFSRDAMSEASVSCCDVAEEIVVAADDVAEAVEDVEDVPLAGVVRLLSRREASDEDEMDEIDTDPPVKAMVLLSASLPYLFRDRKSKVVPAFVVIPEGNLPLCSLFLVLEHLHHRCTHARVPHPCQVAEERAVQGLKARSVTGTSDGSGLQPSNSFLPCTLGCAQGWYRSGLWPGWGTRAWIQLP